MHECEYHPLAVNAVKQFINTPLNIRFSRCKDYEFKLVRLDDVIIPNVIPDSVTLTKLEQKQLAEIMMSEWEKCMQVK